MLTHIISTVLCAGHPGWAGTRNDSHCHYCPLQYQWSVFSMYSKRKRIIFYLQVVHILNWILLITFTSNSRINVLNIQWLTQLYTALFQFKDGMKSDGLTKLIPTNPYPECLSCISTNIHTQHISYSAKPVNQFNTTG